MKDDNIKFSNTNLYECQVDQQTDYMFTETRNNLYSQFTEHNK